MELTSNQKASFFDDANFSIETIKVISCIGFLYGFFNYLVYINHFSNFSFASSYDAFFLIAAVGILGVFLVLLLSFIYFPPWLYLHWLNYEIKQKILMRISDKNKIYTQKQINILFMFLAGFIFWISSSILLILVWKLKLENVLYFWLLMIIEVVCLVFLYCYFFKIKKKSEILSMFFWSFWGYFVCLSAYLPIYFLFGKNIDKLSDFLALTAVSILVGLALFICIALLDYRLKKNSFIILILYMLIVITLNNTILDKNYFFSANIFRILGLGNLENTSLNINEDGKKILLASELPYKELNHGYQVDNITIVLMNQNNYYIKRPNFEEIIIIPTIHVNKISHSVDKLARVD